MPRKCLICWRTPNFRNPSYYWALSCCVSCGLLRWHAHDIVIVGYVAPAVPESVPESAGRQPVSFLLLSPQWYWFSEVGSPLHLTYCNVSLVFNNSHLVAWTVSLYIQNFDLKTRMWLLSTSYLTLYVTVDLCGIFSAREYIYVMHTAYNNGRGCTLNKTNKQTNMGDWARGGGV